MLGARGQRGGQCRVQHSQAVARSQDHSNFRPCVVGRFPELLASGVDGCIPYSRRRYTCRHVQQIITADLRILVLKTEASSMPCPTGWQKEGDDLRLAPIDLAPNDDAEIGAIDRTNFGSNCSRSITARGGNPQKRGTGPLKQDNRSCVRCCRRYGQGPHEVYPAEDTRGEFEPRQPFGRLSRVTVLMATAARRCFKG